MKIMKYNANLLTISETRFFDPLTTSARGYQHKAERSRVILVTTIVTDMFLHKLCSGVDGKVNFQGSMV